MLRLMIVDDEQIIREALSEMVDYESLGYSLIAAAKNGMEAYDIICDEYPDVVITDIRMPVLDGLALIERAMKVDANITFILLSGYSEFEYAKQAMRFGVRYYLLKPTDKKELIDVLVSISAERQQAEEKKLEEQNRILRKIQSPLEECFVKEALDFTEDFADVYRKYQSMLSIPEKGLAACICSFVEEAHLNRFVSDVYQFCGRRGFPVAFPVMYVRKNAVVILEIPSLDACERVREFLENFCYPGQTVSYQTSFLHLDGPELFRKIFAKLSRFDQIILLDLEGERRIVSNNVASTSRIDRLGTDILEAEEEQIPDILGSVFETQMPVETARQIALGLFLRLNPVQTEQPLEIACDFFRKLYNCTDPVSVKELLQGTLRREKACDSVKRFNSNIAQVKAYVERHYRDEYLSLKWIAENYLFVSVGYLSKQFVKEEGIRFSEYLNKVRMEEAKRLMLYYRNENILDIACQVGFGNNPQYFRQAFKRYTGDTPSAYLKKIQKEIIR
ncbi:MAG: response regulator [Candidatus Limivivens sp.]|nr:response regulator [Candidatus Limivivens sp.]